MKTFDQCDVKIVLTSAVEHLEQAGWCRNMLHDYSTGHSCSMGAIIHGVDKSYNDLPASQRELLKEKAYAVLGEQIREWCDRNGRTVPMRYDNVNIAAWNDVQAADKRTVVRVFKKAIDAVECAE